MKFDSRKIGKNKHKLFVQFCKFIFIAFPEESLFAETNTICFFCEEFFGGHLRFFIGHIWEWWSEDDIVLLRWNQAHPPWSHRHHEDEERV